MLIMASNFAQNWLTPEDYVERTTTLLENISVYYPNSRYWIYAHWPETAIVDTFADPSELTDTEFLGYNNYTSGEYWDWHAGWFDEITRLRPHLDLRILPIGQLIADLLDNESYMHSVNFTDLYVDSDPHGNANTYFLSAVATYHGMYRQAPDLVNLTIPVGAPPLLPEIAANLEAISDYMQERLPVYVDYLSHPR
jgi:hypothetical protein